MKQLAQKDSTKFVISPPKGEEVTEDMDGIDLLEMENGGSTVISYEEV